MSTQKTETPSRILARQAAIELSREEIDAVAGGTDCTFTHTSTDPITLDDASGDCAYP